MTPSHSKAEQMATKIRRDLFALGKWADVEQYDSTIAAALVEFGEACILKCAADLVNGETAKQARRSGREGGEKETL